MSRLRVYIQRALGEKDFSNFINLGLNQGINVLVALIVTPFLFRTIGEEQYGLVSLSLTIVMLIGIVVNYGFGLSIPQKLAVVRDNLHLKQSIINEVVNTRILLAIVLSALLIIFTKTFNLFSGYSLILTLSIIQIFNDAVFPLFILQGFDRLNWVARANFVSKIIYLGTVLLIIRSPNDAYLVNFLLGGSGFLVYTFLLLRIYIKESIQYSFTSILRIANLLRENFQFFSSTVATYILINGGFILLKSFVGDSELGFFALAQRVAVLLRMLPVFITQSILQKASRLYKTDINGFNQYLKRSQKKGLMVTFAFCLIISVCSGWVIRLLAGEEIPLSAQLLSILSFLPFIGMLNVSNMIRVLVAEEKYLLSKSIWMTTTFMLLLSLFGAHYFGSIGLAVALIAAEIFNYLITRYYVLKLGLRNIATSR